MKMHKKETSSVDEKSIVVSCGPQVSSSVDEKLMSVGCVDQVRPSINKIIPKGFKLKDIEKTLGEKLDKEIFKFMEVWPVPFLKLLNKIETSVFTLVDKNETISNYKLGKDQFFKFLHKRAQDYCNDNLKNAIEFNKNEIENYKKKTFLDKWVYSIKKRYCAGVILRTSNKKILFTVTTKNLINFPFGKQDHEDEEHFKTTALRELYEEAGHYWKACDAIKGVSRYVDTPFVSKFFYRSKKFEFVEKTHRFYFVDNFEETNIKMDYEKQENPKEIAELKWLDIGVIKKFFSNEGLSNKRVAKDAINYHQTIDLDKNHQPELSIDDDDKKKYSLADSVRNFLLRESPLSDYLLNVSTTLDGCSSDISEVKESYLKLEPKDSQ